MNKMGSVQKEKFLPQTTRTFCIYHVVVRIGSCGSW